MLGVLADALDCVYPLKNGLLFSLLADAWGHRVSLHVFGVKGAATGVAIPLACMICLSGGFLPACLPDIKVWPLIQAVVSDFSRRPFVALGCISAGLALSGNLATNWVDLLQPTPRFALSWVRSQT